MTKKTHCKSASGKQDGIPNVEPELLQKHYNSNPEEDYPDSVDNSHPRPGSTEPQDDSNPKTGSTSPRNTSKSLNPAGSHRAGYVGIIGEPNAGKSTLFNRLLGQKLSIITHKAQTTRHRIQGFYADEDSQIVFLDTPGIIQPSYLLQQHMMDQVNRLRVDADLLLHIVDGRFLPNPDEVVFDTLKELKLPVALVVNKIDKLDPEHISEVMTSYMQLFAYIDKIPISALEGTGVDHLVEMVKSRIPEGPAFYPKEEASDLSVRFFVSELIREQLFLLYQQEIPYSCTVNVIDYKEDNELDRIHAEIVVNRNSQKGIVIGKKGSMMKELGTRSRKSIEQFIGKKVHLELFVKVREKWRENERFLKNYGYR